MYKILIGGAAGDGIETMAGLLEKVIAKEGFFLFSLRDFMSRVRGGHNFALLRFSNKPVFTHRSGVNVLCAFDEESFNAHKHELEAGAVAICDKELGIEHKSLIKIDVSGMAAAAGNPKTAATVFMGALMRLFGFSLKAGQDIISSSMPQKLIEVNLKALESGYNAVDKRFVIEKTENIKGDEQAMLINGAQAMSLGALAAGMNFYSAYPMSPSTTLLEFFSRQSENLELAVEQAEDEIAAINMALGASFAGAKAMTGTSGGGFSLMVEALGFAGIAEIPVVIANIMRPGPATGLPTRTEQSDLSFVVSAAQGEFPRMVIAVRSHEDAFYQTARAFHLAEKYQIPVILLSDQYIADSSSIINEFDLKRAQNHEAHVALFAPNSGEYKRYEINEDGISKRLIPGAGKHIVKVDSDEHDEYGLITESADVRNAMVDKRARKLELLAEELLEPEYHGAAMPQVLFIGFGSTAGALKEAVDILNSQKEMEFGALCFGDVYPLPRQKLMKYINVAQIVVNVEQNSTGQLAALMRREASVESDVSILKYDGRQMSVDYILQKWKEIIF